MLGVELKLNQPAKEATLQSDQERVRVCVNDESDSEFAVAFEEAFVAVLASDKPPQLDT